jgi:hypothetical protein
MALEQAEQALDTGGTLNDLASYLADTPEEASDKQDDEQTADDSTDEEVDTEAEANDEQDIDPDDPDGEFKDEPAPVAKITVKVKGEDGKDETLELTPEEIGSSYLRQRDYTRKTQELAQRETEAVQFLTTKHEEVRNHYLSQAELARAAVAQIAGIRSESEMAELANSDPAAWVAENQRQRQLSAYLNQLDQQINGEKQRAAQEREQRQKQSLQSMYQTAWSELQKDGIDKPKLEKIYGSVQKTYGFSPEELGNVYDHRLVRLMKDATAYQALKAQKPEVTKKVQAAQPMPNKQNAPAREKLDKALENKFRTGRAKLNDLAAYLR